MADCRGDRRASQESGRCKHQSSSELAGGRAAGIGQWGRAIAKRSSLDSRNSDRVVAGAGKANAIVGEMRESPATESSRTSV